MITSIELQMISKILTSESEAEVDKLCSYDPSYYSVFKEQIEFILNHKDKYGDVPDLFTFQAQFPDITLVSVKESLRYLTAGIRENKQHILLMETFNKLKDLGSGDTKLAWEYIANQVDKAEQLDAVAPMDIVKDAPIRAEQVKEFAKQTRIPTGFPEIDKLMYGGLSTIEELLIIVARTNTGKSWVCTRLMESAQKSGFPVAYYSPEMQSSFLGTRFDTWRKNFQNSKLYQGDYSDEYLEYIKALSLEDVSAFVIEDKDMPEGEVSCRGLAQFVKKHGIRLLVVDGLSYMKDDRGASRDVEKYKNICMDLFNNVSKRYGCAVVVAVQANRETKDSKDDKGDPFPNIYNIEGSDHPGRIATQVFSLRQVFEKHVLDIRLEKTRIANNQRPIISYAWDVNNGNCQYIPGSDDNDLVAKAIAKPTIPSFGKDLPISDNYEEDDEEFEDDIEF